ncbi:hypothetical protein [Flavobacterium sp. JP2137]|uniref:hypothetical protein n=1 Tax=Flavobacterium sp. JP2137 TaxID=3414510 RepID=UPI003D2FE25A
MIYLYKTKLNYSIVVFIIVGVAIIGYLLDLSYVVICFLSISALVCNLGINLFYSDLEFKIDSKSKTLEYKCLVMFKIKKELFKLEDLNYEYREVFTKAGIYNQFLLKKGTEIIARPRANIVSFGTNQIVHLGEKLKELGVPRESKK